MHCPKCGQQQVSHEIRYCSRCGFLLTGVAEVVANQGIVPGSYLGSSRPDSPRKRGVKQGAFIFLLTFFVVPILGILAAATGSEPVAAGIAAVLLIFGGLLRIVYALMFESSEPGIPTLEENILSRSQNYFNRTPSKPGLPAGDASQAGFYTAPGAGVWRDTKDLAPSPGSVTDTTTKLLSKERDQ